MSERTRWRVLLLVMLVAEVPVFLIVNASLKLGGVIAGLICVALVFVYLLIGYLAMRFLRLFQ